MTRCKGEITHGDLTLSLPAIVAEAGSAMALENTKRRHIRRRAEISQTPAKAMSPFDSRYDGCVALGASCDNDNLAR